MNRISVLGGRHLARSSGGPGHGRHSAAGQRTKQTTKRFVSPKEANLSQRKVRHRLCLSIRSRAGVSSSESPTSGPFSERAGQLSLDPVCWLQATHPTSTVISPIGRASQSYFGRSGPFSADFRCLGSACVDRQNPADFGLRNSPSVPRRIDTRGTTRLRHPWHRHDRLKRAVRRHRMLADRQPLRVVWGLCGELTARWATILPLQKEHENSFRRDRIGHDRPA